MGNKLNQNDSRDQSLRADISYREFRVGRVYTFENGNLVLTAAYLSARGTCCDQGCRHCPYGTNAGT